MWPVRRQGDERKARGETSGYQRYIRGKNGEICADFADGLTIEELIPKTSEGKRSNWLLLHFSIGFVLMILDVTQG